MKGFIRKISLSVFVTIAALAMFTTVALAWGDDYSRNSYLLRGTYAFTGSGNCVFSAGGQNLFTLIQIWEGEYTFDGHGSGSFKGTFRAVDLYPGNPFGSAGPNAISKAVASWEFNYEMTDDNRFETWLKPGTYDKVYDPTGVGPTNYFDIQGDRFHGAVERDGASIVVTSGPPMIHYLCGSDPTQPPYDCPHVAEALCSESVVGLRVSQ